MLRACLLQPTPHPLHPWSWQLQLLGDQPPDRLFAGGVPWEGPGSLERLSLLHLLAAQGTIFSFAQVKHLPWRQRKHSGVGGTGMHCGVGGGS